MDEKTEELRDIFMDVSEEGTVTETQSETRGSFVDEGDDADAELRETVAAMRERYAFETDLDRETYCSLVRAVYDEGDDEAVAESLGLSPETVFRARLDLHLVDEADLPPAVDPATLRRRRDADAETLAAEFGVDPAEVRRARAVVAAEDEARAANHRYREAFDEALTDAALAGRYTDAAQDDGLEEAAEDIETDVSF